MIEPVCRGCFLSGTGSEELCRVHGCYLCGDIMLADSEEYPHRTCPDHYEAYVLGFEAALALPAAPSQIMTES